MKQKNSTNTFKTGSLLPFSKIFFPLLITSIIWAVKIIEVSYGLNFSNLGILPRDWNTIWHIFTAPFIHGNWSHIYYNTLYWLVFSTMVFYLYPKRAYLYMLSAFFDTGIILWIIGRPSHHIGLSGVIYALASFIFFENLLSRKYTKMAISLALIFMFGGMAYGLFPKDVQVSWEGHVSGVIVGFFLAIIENKFAEIEDIEQRRKLYKDYT
jgi:membrane associated rhomboid family serine protease